MLLLKPYIETYKEKAKMTFAKYKNHITCYIFNYDNNIQLIACLLKNEEEKHILVKKIKDNIRDGHITEYIFISEAWFIQKSNDNKSELNKELELYGGVKVLFQRYEKSRSRNAGANAWNRVDEAIKNEKNAAEKAKQSWINWVTSEHFWRLWIKEIEGAKNEQ